MTKRLIIRKGDVFCVEIENEYKCFFQYIEKDATQLSANVIRAFKTRYPITYEPIVDEIVKDDVSFYAHTIIRFGTHYNAWHKVGAAKDVGDTENICFRLFDDKWYIWKINGKFQFIDELTDEVKRYDFGWVFSYKEIIKKIQTGNYSDWLEFKVELKHKAD